MARWERIKPPSTAAMPGVSFPASALNAAGSVVLFSGQRRGLSAGLWLFRGGEFVELPATGPSWPAARTQASLTGVGSLESGERTLYLFGGYAVNVGAVGDLWELVVLDEESSRWRQLECDAPPPPRYGHSSVEFHGGVVIFGGQDDERQFSDVWTFSPAPQSWAEVATSGGGPSPRTRHSATMLDEDNMLVLGGFSRNDRYLNDAHLLNLKAGVWSALPLAGAPLAGIAQHAAAARDGRVFLFGGFDGTRNRNDLIVIDVNDKRVHLLNCQNPPEPRSRISAHFLDSKLYVFGGFDGGKPHGGDVFSIDCSDPSAMAADDAQA